MKLSQLRIPLSQTENPVNFIAALQKSRYESMQIPIKPPKEKKEKKTKAKTKAKGNKNLVAVSPEQLEFLKKAGLI